MSHLIFLAVILGAAGGLAGFLAGVFGVGGGTVVVPVLYEVFIVLGVPDELRMPLCAGTSLALIIPTSIASFTSHRKTDAVNVDLLRLWSVPIIVGVIGGTVLARYAPAAVFKAAFVLVALLTAVRLIFRDRLPTLGQDVPRRVRLPYGLTIGLSASLIGIGGGILSNMIMTFHGRAIHESVATSAGVGVMVSIPGALGYMAAGWDRMGLPPFRRIRLDRRGFGSDADELSHCEVGRARRASCFQAAARALLCKLPHHGWRTVWLKSTSERSPLSLSSPRARIGWSD